MDTPTREQIYDDQINPLMAQIIAIAQEHEIPMHATFQLKSAAEDPEQGAMFCSTALFYPWGDSTRFKAFQDVALAPPQMFLMTVGVVKARK